MQSLLPFATEPRNNKHSRVSYFPTVGFLREVLEPSHSQKYQLKVKMCCSKCAEKVEEILEVYGVFDVRVEHLENKVVVVATPNGLDEHEVLMKARKIHKKAKFVELDAKEKPKDNNKKREEGKGETEENKQGKKELRATPSDSKSNVVPVNWPSWPIASNAPRFLYPPSHILHYPNPHGQLVQFTVRSTDLFGEPLS